MADDNRTFHITPTEVWQRQRAAETYWPDAFAEDGFIHCTIGVAELMAVGNRFWRDDARPFVALELDLSALSSPVKTEDPAKIYPHIFGPIERTAIVAVHPVVRSADGEFLSLG